VIAFTIPPTIMKTDCIFCRIIAGAAPADIIYRDEQVVAFLNLNPIAPVHLLIVPVKHIESVNTSEVGDETAIGHLFTVARLLAVKYGIDQSGYRLIVNTGPDAGQSVFHLHLHIIGGRRISFLVE
jgi:histidine triad (HIT) family protein